MIIDTLYLLIEYGQGMSHSFRSIMSLELGFDREDDFFRIYLVCTLPQTVLRHPALQKAFISDVAVYCSSFELYVFAKKQLSADISFVLDDTYEKLSSIGIERHKSVVAAKESLLSLCAGATLIPESFEKAEIEQPQNVKPSDEVRGNWTFCSSRNTRIPLHIHHPKKIFLMLHLILRITQAIRT